MRVVIIGAGPSGLVTCKSLLEAATSDFAFEPVILEQEDGIGGTFRYRSYEVSVYCTCPSTFNLIYLHFW
jgi:dimethylaniline monooxygenase (N-oxide forming)